jgi:hypothetical protein
MAGAALREGIDALPGAYLDERALEIRLLLDHHDDLVADRRDEQCRLRWHLHDLFEDLQIPAGALDREVWLTRLARRLTAAYLTRKQAEGKTRMDALRCLKRHLARRVWQLLRAPTPDQANHTHMIKTNNTNNNANAPEPAPALT